MMVMTAGRRGMVLEPWSSPRTLDAAAHIGRPARLHRIDRGPSTG